MSSLQELLEYRQKFNRFGNYIGVQILEMKEGYAKCELKLQGEFMNPNLTVHGGVIFSLADIAAGSAASSYGLKCTTLNSSISFLAAAKDSKVLYCEALQIKHGKTISVFETPIVDETNKLIATGTFTFFCLGTPILGD